jgi:ligand-binding sensor domain-containing protein
MKKIANLFALFLVLVFYTSCKGQNQTNSPKDNTDSETKETVSSYWSNKDTVLQIRKGSNGTILIVAMRGIFRYDGKSFTKLTNKLGSLKFQDALEDRKGNLWLASDSGVCYYNGKSFQHLTTRDGLPNNWVFCIYEDKAGIIWFGTWGGASRYNGKSFQNFITKGEYRWDTFITTFMEDKTGKLWISARGDIYIYDGKTFATLPYKDEKVYDVYSIIEDKKGNIWLGGWDGLRRYDGKTFIKFAHYTGYNFMIEDKKGNIWVAGKIKGPNWAVSRYDQKSLSHKKPTVTEIMSGTFQCYSGILEADDGSIWFGKDGGLYSYDGKNIRDFTGKK